MSEITPENVQEKLNLFQQMQQQVQALSQQASQIDMSINETERKNALMKLDDDLDQQDYFQIQEQKLKIGCLDCEIEKMPALRILYSSDSFIRQGDNLYYYLKLPQSELKKCWLYLLVLLRKHRGIRVMN